MNRKRREDTKKMIEITSFLVLFFWFLSVSDWNPLKYSLAALLILLVVGVILDLKLRYSKKRGLKVKL